MQPKKPTAIPLPQLLETFFNAQLILRLCMTHVVINVSRNSCCDFALNNLFDSARSMLRLCSTHPATLRDPCCDFARLKHLAGVRNFGRRKSISATHFGRNMSHRPRPGWFATALIYYISLKPIRNFLRYLI